MPFRSKAQQGYLYAHPEKVGGKKKLEEWSSDTDFNSLPERVESGAASDTNTPRKKKFSFAPQKTRAGYTKDQRNA